MEILEAANDIYKQHKQDQAAVNFLNNRGVLDKTITDFEIGFSPSFCLRELMSEQSQGLRRVGLLNEKGNERNWGRLMFPVRDVYGKLVGFNGRSVIDDSSIKYLLSPDYGGFFKSQILYNLHQAKTTITSENNVYLVEGVFDVMALHQTGVDNAVCGLGTSLSDMQIEQLAKHTNQFTIMFDGDEAGFKASIKNARKIKNAMNKIDPSFNPKEQIKFIAFDEGRDAGDYLKNPDELKQFIKQATSYNKFIQHKCSIDGKYKKIMVELNKAPKKTQQLSRDLIHAITSQVNIVDVVSDYVSLQRQGASYKALCPFPDHDEATPSFVVTPHKNICKCFGCGNGGNVISFVAKMENVSNYDAAIILKEKYSLDIKVQDTTDYYVKDDQNRLNADMKLLEFSKGFLNYLQNNKILNRTFKDEELKILLERNNFKSVKISHFRQILNQCYKKEMEERVQKSHRTDMTENKMKDFEREVMQR